MMPGNLFCLQLTAAFRDRRQIVLRIGVSLLLSLPFLLVGMPARVQAAGITMVILFTGFFGSAVSHAHLRADQRLARLSLLPMPRRVLYLDLVLSSIVMRLGPAAVVLAGFVIVTGRNVTPGVLLKLAGLLCATLGLLTLLGMATGRLARNNAEVHLFGALATAMLAVLSGVMPVPARLAGLTTILSWNPVARLLMALEGLTGGSPAPPGDELFLSLTVLGALVTAATLRWIAGGAQGIRRFNAVDILTGRRAYMEVQADDSGSRA